MLYVYPAKETEIRHQPDGNTPPVKKIAFDENFRIFGDKRLNVVAMRVTRVFHVSYTFYAQRYPQLLRC